MSAPAGELPDPAPPDLPEVTAAGSPFLRQLLIATLSLLLLVLILHLLERFRGIFQPLFIGTLIAYLVLPIHGWLVRRGMPSLLAHAAILVLLVLVLVGIGTLAYRNYQELTVRLPVYEERLEFLVRDAITNLPVDLPEGKRLREFNFRQYVSAQQLLVAMGAAVGTFFDFFTWLAVTLVYLLFIIVESETFPHRIRRAFGPQRGEQVLNVIVSINQAIAQYFTVKTLVSVLAGLGSLIVLLVFGVDFAITWALLIFLFNYIPYLGSLVATTLPIVLSFVQLDSGWQALAVALLLIGIQQAIGTIVEPRLAGQRLNVSPLLILLALAFWGALWGIVGMILAVPILMIVKIVLDNIKETRPLATLMSNL